MLLILTISNYKKQGETKESCVQNLGPVKAVDSSLRLIDQLE